MPRVFNKWIILSYFYSTGIDMNALDIRMYPWIRNRGCVWGDCAVEFGLGIVVGYDDEDGESDYDS